MAGRRGIGDSAEIESLIAQDGCPACNACVQGLSRYSFWFFNQSYAEGSAVGQYVRNWGFCIRHTAMMASAGPVWQKSAIYGWIIRNQLPGLKRLAGSLRRRAPHYVNRRMARGRMRKTVDAVAPTGACVFCEHEEQTAHDCISELLEAVSEEKGRSIYEKSSGLCMRHFFLMLDRFCEPAYARRISVLVDLQIARLEQLGASIEEFFRKSDYRRSDEPKGEEQTAWSRAASRFVGRLDG